MHPMNGPKEQRWSDHRVARNIHGWLSQRGEEGKEINKAGSKDEHV